MNKRIVYIAGWMIVLVLSSCSPRALREARETVVRADSMRAAGQMYEDSSCLAQAYKTLGAIPFPFREGLGVGSAYAHACYHYGRLLRAKENPVAAMQCFIDATHSRTHDYPILGRVYSNMGSIAHLAGEYDLSYTMYSHSSEMFLRANDTTAYYYALNDMAFELAEQGKREETMSLLSKIEVNDADSYLLAKIWETKAEVCLLTQKYDSAICYAHKMQSSHIASLLWEIQIAQAYSFLHIKDSASHYANIVLLKTKSLYELNNALYILTNDDMTKDNNAIREIAADRSDTQKLLEIRQGKVSQAVQLLRQDLNNKPNLLWLYAIIITLIIIGAVTIIYVSYKRKKHQLLSQKIADLENKNIANITQKKQEILDCCTILANSPNIKDDLCWNDFNQMCNFANKHFGLLVLKLQQTYNLSEREIRLCVLSLLNMSYDSMADLLYYAPNGIGKFKLRVAQKLGTTARNLQQFLIDIAMGK